jgi:hypothetical protein
MPLNETIEIDLSSPPHALALAATGAAVGAVLRFVRSGARPHRIDVDLFALRILALRVRCIRLEFADGIHSYYAWRIVRVGLMQHPTITSVEIQFASNLEVPTRTIWHIAKTLRDRHLTMIAPTKEEFVFREDAKWAVGVLGSRLVVI